MDILETYRLFRKMNQYPNLTGLMFSVFMEVLEKRGIITQEKLYQQALKALKADGVPDTEINRQEYVEGLIGYYSANSLSDHEIENYINLARKKDKCQELSFVVNQEQATSLGIYNALREFCEIPKGEVYISREEAEGIARQLRSSTPPNGGASGRLPLPARRTCTPSSLTCTPQPAWSSRRASTALASARYKPTTKTARSIS